MKSTIEQEIVIKCVRSVDLKNEAKENKNFAQKIVGLLKKENLVIKEAGDSVVSVKTTDTFC